MNSIPVKTTSTLDKKDVQKLQRAIIDGLEDVKAQDIQVFDTEHITSLFERVIIASGTSNRQTKALAASVRDAVRDAGFAKPRVEGESNGEWIIVDCGAAVAHIMQPTIRQYYHLEELWGDKPIKLKLGAPTPLVKAAKPEVKAEPKTVKAGAKGKPAGKTSVKALPAKTADSSYIGKIGKANDWTATRNASAPAAEPLAKPVRAAAKKSAAPAPSKPMTKPVKTAAKAVAKPAAKTPLVKVPVAKKVVVKKTATKAAVAKTADKKPAPRKTTTRSQ